MLVHPTLLPIALETLKSHLRMSEEEIRKRVIIMARKREYSDNLNNQGFLDLDDLLANCAHLPSLPERFEGQYAQTIASIYFSSGALTLAGLVRIASAYCRHNRHYGTQQSSRSDTLQYRRVHVPVLILVAVLRAWS